MAPMAVLVTVWSAYLAVFLPWRGLRDILTAGPVVRLSHWAVDNSIVLLSALYPVNFTCLRHYNTQRLLNMVVFSILFSSRNKIWSMLYIPSFTDILIDSYQSALLHCFPKSSWQS